MLQPRGMPRTSIFTTVAGICSFWALPSAEGRIDPVHSTAITVYHVNPLQAGSMPIDQNTGDVGGDLYWYLGEFLLPEECKSESKVPISKFDCENTERAGDLIATQLTIEVDSRFTKYSACNLCNGTDPFSGRPCKEGEYKCDCWGLFPWACNTERVGRESIVDVFGPPPTSPRCLSSLDRHCGKHKGSGVGCFGCTAVSILPLALAGCSAKDPLYYCPGPFGSCSPSSPDWVCWRQNIAKKARGYWYSTSKKAMCSPDSSEGSCSWKAVSTRSIKESCLRESVLSAVEAENRTCFDACGPRNETSSCWIGCFFDTLLGPEARNDSIKPLAGMPLERLTEAWERAFRSEEHGGCPFVDMVEADASISSRLKLAEEASLSTGAGTRGALQVNI